MRGRARVFVSVLFLKNTKMIIEARAKPRFHSPEA